MAKFKLCRQGLVHDRELPFVMGLECAGIVLSINKNH